jgi:diguanylate cyclase (GGDEF)-like protein
MALELDGKRVANSVSIGLASYPQDGNSMDALVARADRAMYQAKQAGRNRVLQFNLPAAAE